MSSPSKAKGNTYERELVNKAKTYGLHAIRAYASNGKALGEAETVDLKIDDVRVQAKRRKAIASFLRIPEGCEAVMFREDNGNTMVLIDLDLFLQLLHERDYGRLPKRQKKVLTQSESDTARIIIESNEKTSFGGILEYLPEEINKKLATGFKLRKPRVKKETILSTRSTDEKIHARV